MKNIGHNKNTCEEKKIFAPKMALENRVITYKSQILKFKIQQKVFNKIDVEWYVGMLSIFFIFTKKNFLSEKIAKNQKLLVLWESCFLDFNHPKSSLSLVLRKFGTFKRIIPQLFC